MPKIEWNSRLSVGVDAIDDQHKELIRIGNALLNAAALGRDKQILDNVISKLREYTVFHFSSEEKLMEDIRYPDRGEHGNEHARLKKEVKDYQRMLYKQEALDPDEMLKFLEDWIIVHIHTQDRELAHFIHGQDVEKALEVKDPQTTPQRSKDTKMTQIQWNEELSVGVEEIDDQHRQLIDIANALMRAVEQGKSKEILDTILQQLREYTVIHFNKEQQLMEKIRYPGRGEQIEEHTQLKRDVLAFQQKVFRQEDLTSEDVLSFMKEWLLIHILNYDRKLAKYINEREGNSKE